MITVFSKDNSKAIGVCSFSELSQTDRIVLALGMFDGVHIAHREIIKRTVELAKRLDATPTMLTFCNHPAETVSPENVPKLLTTNTEKAMLCAEYGIKQIVLVWFDDEFSELSPEDFLEKYVSGFDCVGIVCGYDYKFGKNASGNTGTLIEYANKKKLAFEVVDRMTLNDITVGSSYIRMLIGNGELEEAESFSGHRYVIGGEVSHGFERGRSIGFPTANILPKKEKAMLPDGVYGTVTYVDGKEYLSVTNIGKNPTFSNESSSVETYLIDFEGDLYGKYITVEFVFRIRDEIRFQTAQELRLALEKDVETVKNKKEQ